MKKTIKYSIDIMRYVSSWFISIFLPIKKEIWIISERHDEARDNGYFFYKYLVSTKVPKLIYYAIDYGVSDESKIVKIGGKRVRFGSFAHYIIYHKAKVCLSTHIYGYSPSRPVCCRLDKLFHKTDKTRVFLQHGIIMNFHPADMYEGNNISLYVCSAEREKNFLMKANHYPENVMCLTGMSRYDDLLATNLKKQILVMPTWRAYLNNANEQEFTESLYFKNFDKLLNDEKLASLIDDNDYDLIFYPHYEMQKFIHLFKSKCKRIIIANHESFDVHELLRDSRILITDYSSVHFDFAYMKKPIAYFQFDSELFYGKHYQKGYYDFSRDGFGPIIKDYKDVSSFCEYYINCKNVIDKLYSDRIDRFYKYRDINNSERIYERIKTISN